MGQKEVTVIVYTSKKIDREVYFSGELNKSKGITGLHSVIICLQFPVSIGCIYGTLLIK